MAAAPEPTLYRELAGWFHLLTAPDEYADEAGYYARALAGAAGQATTLLELGSGGGNNAAHLKARFRCTLTDLSPAMLAESRRINPLCEHVAGDMRSLRLGRTFDVVLVHDAISCLTRVEELRAAMATAFVHCRSGGAALFAPDFTVETFRPSTECGGRDGQGRALRYLCWTWDPDPADSTYVSDFALLLREDGRAPWVVLDRHELGVFPRATWSGLLAEAGFEERPPPDAGGVETGQILLAVRP